MNNALLSSPRRRWWATAGAIAAAVAVGGTALGLQDSHAESPTAGAAPQGVPVSVAAVLQKDIALWDEFSGRLEAVQRVEVRPRVAGALQAVHFKEGALVKQGDLLVTVDPAPAAAGGLPQAPWQRPWLWVARPWACKTRTPNRPLQVPPRRACLCPWRPCCKKT